MTLAFICALICIRQPQAEMVSLGSTRLMGKEVAIQIPAATPPGPQTPVIEFGDWKCRIEPDGRMSEPYLVDGKWGDVAVRYRMASQKVAASTPAIWRTKVLIQTRASILDRGADGLLRFRRSTLEESQVARILGDLARLKAMSEAESGGAIQMEIDVSVDDDPVRFIYGEGLTGARFDRAFVTSSVSPRINGSAFDADDKVYRGPFHSVFVIQAALTAGVPFVEVSGTPVSAFSPYADGAEGHPNGLSTRLFAAWQTHVWFHLNRAGYPLEPCVFAEEPARPGAMLTDAEWRAAAELSSPRAAYLQRRFGAGRSGAKAWIDVAADPWGVLRLLQPTDLQVLCGASRFEIGDRYITVTREGLPTMVSAACSGPDAPAIPLTIDLGDRQLVLVRGAFARLFGEYANVDSPPVAHGFAIVGGEPLVVFEAKGAALLTPDVNGFTSSTTGFSLTKSGSGLRMRLRSTSADWQAVLPDGQVLKNDNGQLLPEHAQLVRLKVGTAERWAYLPRDEPAPPRVAPVVPIGADRKAFVDVHLPDGIGAGATLEWQLPPQAKIVTTTQGSEGVSTTVIETDGQACQVSVGVQHGGVVGQVATVQLRPIQVSAAPSESEFLSSAAIQDADRGTVVEITERGNFRRGVVGWAGPGPLADARVTPFLEFELQATSPDPLAIRLIGAEGEVAAELVLGGSGVMPSEVAEPAWPRAIVGLTSDGTWQRVSVDLRTVLGANAGPIHALELSSPSGAGLQERKQFGEVKYRLSLPVFLAEARWQASLRSEPQYDDAETAALVASRMPAELSELDQGKLAELLEDKRDVVRLNAAGVLMRAMAPDLIPIVANAAKSVNPIVAMVAMSALEHQGTEASGQAIRQCLERGPFDFTRQIAAGLLASKPDAKLAGPLTILITSRSWRSRAEAARAIGSIPGREAAIIQMTFLQEVDPGVRWAVASTANPDVDLVVKRLRYSAVNDPSEAVRLASYLALLRARANDVQAEGAKGIRDESIQVRLGILGAAADMEDDRARSICRVAVVDVDPRVRAEALYRFAALKGAVSSEEVQNVFLDTDPVVQRALIRLAHAKKLTISADTLRILRSSIDPEVVRLAKELPG